LRLKHKNNSNVIVIHGIGAVGKTQLVLEYAYSHDKEFTSIIWVNAESTTSAERSFLDFACRLLEYYVEEMKVSAPYTKIAQQLGMTSLINEDGQIDLAKCNTARIVDAVKIWLRRNENDNWLIIFDHVDDLEPVDVSHFFVDTSNVCHILTSRRRECARLGRDILLEGMHETESIDLLSRSSQRKIKHNDRDTPSSIGTHPPSIFTHPLKYRYTASLYFYIYD
jgi:hypothetical protein